MKLMKLMATGVLALAAAAAAPLARASDPVAQTAPPPPACSLAVASNKVLVVHRPHAERGVLMLTVTCSQFVNATLTGQVTELAGHGHRRRSVAVAALHLYVPGNAPTALAMRLPKKALAALAAGTTESATVKLAAVNEHGTAVAATSLSALKPLR